MSNVICFKTRQVIVENPEQNAYADQDARLVPLLQRLDLDNRILALYAIRLQNENNGPYIGDCPHGIFEKKHVTPFPFPNYKCSPKTVLGLGILDGSEPDPFMHMDRKYKATFSIMSHAKLIYTRSDLIAHDDYIAQLNKDAKIFIVFRDTDDEINREKEPGCPSYKRRLKAYDKLKTLGFNVKMLDESKSLKLKVVI